MAYTFDDAFVEVATHVKAQWDIGVPAIVGFADPELRLAETESPKLFTKTGGRFVMESVTNPQSSLRNAEFGQRYTNYGIVIVQLLIRRNGEESPSIARKLGDYVKDIFRDPAFPGCSIFQNTRVLSLEPEAMFLRRNVVTEYQFDELT